MSSHPHGIRFSPFNQGNKNAILSAQQQPQQQTPIQQTVTMRQHRKSATPTNIPAPTPKIRESKQTAKGAGFSDTDDDEQDYFDDESDANLSREERYVLLQPRAEPQGQENLSGNVTPVNDSQRKLASSIFKYQINANLFDLFSTEHLRENVINDPSENALFKRFHGICTANSLQQPLESQHFSWPPKSPRSKQSQPKKFSRYSTALQQKFDGPSAVKSIVFGRLAVFLQYSDHTRQQRSSAVVLHQLVAIATKLWHEEGEVGIAVVPELS